MKTIQVITSVVVASATWFAGTQARGDVTLSTLASFTYTNSPNYGWNFETYNSRTSALVQGEDGNFYGTTYEGGTDYVQVTEPPTYGYGTIFRITPDGTFTSLYSFGTITDSVGNALDGRSPLGNLTKAADGTIYGTTFYGGALHTDQHGAQSDGTIFRITTNGEFTSLWSFGHDPSWSTDDNAWTNSDGRFPMGGVVQGRDGNFYGTTSADGAYGRGTVFQLSAGRVTTLHSFTDDLLNGGTNADGACPRSELVEGRDGAFYGTTYWGGTNGYGTVFKITPDGTFTSLFSFDGLEGGYPNAPLALGDDGKLYGVTTLNGGTAFQITPNGQFTVLHEFNLWEGPPSGLLQGRDGNFYGTTQGGGNSLDGRYHGTVFQLTTNGTLTTLYAFSGPDGDWPQGALVQGTNGDFYGTTSYGGPGYDGSVLSGFGTIFRLTLNRTSPVIQSSAQTNGQFTFTWSATPGLTYQVQYNSVLSSSGWTNLGDPVLGTNSLMTTSDAMGPEPQRFYRVVLLP